MATHVGRFGKSRTRQIEEFLRTPDAAKLTNTQIAAQFGAHPVLISRIKSRLGLARTYKKLSRPIVPIDIPKPAPTVPYDEPPPETDSAPTVEAIINSSVLTPQEQRERLSWLAHHAAREGDQVSALRALQQLDAALSAHQSPGPGVPLTDEDRIRRLSLLLEACGEELSAQAWKRAFTRAPETASGSPLA